MASPTPTPTPNPTPTPAPTASELAPSPTPTSVPTAVPTPSPTASPSFLSITPPSVSFENVGVDTTASATIKLKNLGKNKLSGSLSNSGLSGTSFSLAAGLGNFHLTRNQTKVVTIKFRPTAPVASSGSITITSNDPANGAVQIGVSGTGVAGLLSVQSALNFPTLKVDQSKSLKFAIENIGLGVLDGSIDTSGLTAPFSATGGSFTLASGRSRVVTVKFAPSAVGMFQQTITITSNGADPANASVVITGSGR